MLICHVLLYIRHPLDECEAHKALKAISALEDLILQQKLQVAGIIIICKE